MGERAVWVALALGGCAYQPGGVARYPGVQVTLGCVELAVAEVAPAPVPGKVIAYTFGNRCEHAVTLDLGAARVVGRDALGREVALAPRDPRHEIRPLPLVGLWWGSEQLEYREPGGGMPVALVSVCVDVGALVPGVAVTPRWACSDATSAPGARR
jgi:hypothetical protein